MGDAAQRDLRRQHQLRRSDVGEGQPTVVAQQAARVRIEEIDVAIPIEVADRQARRGRAERRADAEAADAVVDQHLVDAAEQRVGGERQVEVAVPIQIHGDAARRPDTGQRGRDGEAATAVVAQQSARQLARAAAEENVHVAISIAVERRRDQPLQPGRNLRDGNVGESRDAVVAQQAQGAPRRRQIAAQDVEVAVAVEVGRAGSCNRNCGGAWAIADSVRQQHGSRMEGDWRSMFRRKSLDGRDAERSQVQAAAPRADESLHVQSDADQLRCCRDRERERAATRTLRDRIGDQQRSVEVEPQIAERWQRQRCR
ncbi:hypothetical protein DAPPUDRAFT_124345 [Daphnia pulex]|uniref:Uncharacterized protein n=1 Tax=Daphnia pulex TaxID=6669 RepID=E9I6I8_DAPPU|nr:hypothetical protein DAPPUDRAFT_124345 [Daphnia pulex]|eukprot:EFX60392.1 hypothetical protein DAPPUDRAFT_124345 [Daphnia pulex]